MSLQDKINAKLASWAKTPDGKAKISAKKKDALKEGKILGSGVGYGAGTGIVAAADVDFYRDRFLEILREKIHEAGFNFADEDNVLVNGGFNNSTGYYEYHYNFDPESIKRTSLDPERYPEGAYDIVALMNHGYDANGHVYGYWEPAGKKIRSLQTREGAFFIQKATEEFEALYGGIAKISYNEKYDRRG